MLFKIPDFGNNRKAVRNVRLVYKYNWVQSHTVFYCSTGQIYDLERGIYSVRTRAGWTPKRRTTAFRHSKLEM